MAIDVSQIRTLQDVINVLSVVCFNMNEMERIYYDMYINPVPTDITFQRYDDQGILEKITIPNRAKDRQNTLTGEGSPEGVVKADAGSLYLDTIDQNLYFKGAGAEATGWLEVYSSLNLSPDRDFLRPNGDGSQLQNLNMANANSGVLGVDHGGTGSATVTGIVKGNGTSPYSAAIDGVDYMGASSMTGIIAYYPVESIPIGWLVCDGKAYSRTDYSRLYKVIGTTYGSGDGSTSFNVPNLLNYYIRCWDGEREFNVVQNGQVGKHRHGLSGNTGDESSHTHTRGSMEIEGTTSLTASGDSSGYTGAFEIGTGSSKGGATNGTTPLNFKASNSWTGVTSGGSPHSHALVGSTKDNIEDSEDIENRVINKVLVPVIKY